MIFGDQNEFIIYEPHPSSFLNNGGGGGGSYEAYRYKKTPKIFYKKLKLTRELIRLCSGLIYALVYD